jgi:phosphoribosylaminoimidazolecarboxamide formyltransferase/IMP cyclohydrolase
MSQTKIKRALLAVFDKTGIADFAKQLVDDFGIEILSTGGTARHLKEAGVPVTMVEQVTGFPEMMDGRVKTLHPVVHAGILADRDKPEHMKQMKERGIEPIDMIVVNLYPFEDTIAQPDCTFAQAIEMIDIGGPTMLRAAAKNHKHVVVMPDLEYADEVLNELKAKGDVSPELRLELAMEVFSTTFDYDCQISTYLQEQMSAQAGVEEEGDEIEDPWFSEDSDGMLIDLPRFALTRYGENPAQKASVWLAGGAESSECNLLLRRDVEGKERPSLIHGEMSYNNYMDGDAALSLVKDLTQAPLGKKCAVAFIKHMNACGCAVGDDPKDTYMRAYLGDPIAAAGGVLCMNFPVTKDVAEMVMTTFPTWGKAAGAAFFKLDVWIAPEFDEDAIKLITTPTEKRKWGASCRLLAVGPMDTAPDEDEVLFKSITGGMLIQQRDLLALNEGDWKVVTKRKPTEAEMADLRFAWLVCKHTKSNAIVVCKDDTLLGSGAGQMSRVKSCDISIQLSNENNHGDKLKGAVAAGDAFFPVEDGPQKLIDAGVTAIIQPGGSNRDSDTLRVCDENNVAMLLTGCRHFKH